MVIFLALHPMESIPLYSFVLLEHVQGCRRVFESGPAEEVIECRRHERGRTREGIIPPFVRGILGTSPGKIFEFWALLCAFLIGVYALGTRF